MLQCIFRLCVRVLKLGYNGVQRVGGVFGVVFGGLVNFFVVLLINSISKNTLLASYLV